MDAHTPLDESATAAPAAAIGPSTASKRPHAPVAPDSVSKRLTSRSNQKSATDKLLEDKCIDSYAWFLSKKRRYVPLKLSEMLDALNTLYSSFFKQHWSDFSRTMDRFTITGTPAASAHELLACVYLSHWVHDTYRTIRRTLTHLDPVAFNEKYHHEVATHSDYYDNFLATLNAHLRPTHITLSYADELFIPVLDKKMNFKDKKPISWSKYHFDYEIFQLILTTLERRKMCKLTPLASDLQGRPSWLFDWSPAQEAYAWFPQEANYNDDDVTIAYIVGVTCSPKMGHTDVDDWKYVAKEPQPRTFALEDYVRVAPRRYKGSIEFRTFEMQPAHYPALELYTTKGKEDEWKATNKGPLAIVEDLSKSLSSQTIADPEDEVIETDTVDFVPDSPRVRTRSTAASSSFKPWRTRVTDHLYYRQVIRKMVDSSRRTAFQMMIRTD